jgi:uncharacterized protein YpmB
VERLQKLSASPKIIIWTRLTWYEIIIIIIIIVIVIIITAIEFSLGGSSPYTSTDKTNNIHERNNTKTQYKQYKTQ